MPDAVPVKSVLELRALLLLRDTLRRFELQPGVVEVTVIRRGYRNLQCAARLMIGEVTLTQEEARKTDVD